MDITGRTAMLHAVDCDSSPCVRLLLEAGADTNPKLPKGVFRSSPLTAAAMGGKRDLMRVLLEFDADANIRNPEGLTPLHSVARFRTADCALVLLEHGADLNALSRDGRTPLTMAIIYNNHEVLQLFIDRCYEYITSARLRGPQLLPVIAEYADIRTMSILASSHPLKLSYDISPGSMIRNRELLLGRFDYSEKLLEIFEELITIAQVDNVNSPSVDSLLESGLFRTARSSFRSDLAEAMEALDFSDGSTDGSVGKFEDSREALSPIEKPPCTF
ncbi:ankyrin [Patellaria atrata CBS 101060]|uniref:Ankyrin n=1 Tax=Patellaria atrata CBS 101060 TaxID=1346257 RepID=A0A9P4VQ65_9PEZI|nr:ankyrin [Patellaria atrata CBS 101060]